MKQERAESKKVHKTENKIIKIINIVITIYFGTCKWDSKESAAI